MTAKKKRVEFKLSAPEAREVLVSGTFNQWSASSDPMARDASGTWRKVKVLAPGTYEYKFVVDGAWMPDPDCPARVPDGCGSENSRLELAAAAPARKRGTG